jgi:hypothetical protein
MRAIRLILLVLALSGCSVFVASYDANEYALVNKIRTLAETQDCSRRNIVQIRELSIEFKNYSEFQPHNQVTFELASDLDTLTGALASRQSFNLAYCKSKMKTIASSAKTIQSTIGNKPR